MPQQTINLPRDTTMQSIVSQLQAIASALNLDWSTIANKPSNISFHGTAATPGASVSPVGNNTPIKPCQDANGDRFSPEVFEESMYNNDGTPMHPAPGKMIAKEYDPAETYPTFSPYCINDNKFYKFSGSSTTTGSFDPSEWTEIDAADEFTALNSTLTQFNTPITIDNILDTTTSDATNVVAKIYKTAGSPICRCYLTFKLTTDSPSTGSNIGILKERYIYSGIRVIVPCVDDTSPNLTCALFCNNTGSRMYKVYSGKANHLYYVNFMCILENNVNV